MGISAADQGPTTSPYGDNADQPSQRSHHHAPTWNASSNRCSPEWYRSKNRTRPSRKSRDSSCSRSAEDVTSLELQEQERSECSVDTLNLTNRYYRMRRNSPNKELNCRRSGVLVGMFANRLTRSSKILATIT